MSPWFRFTRLTFIVPPLIAVVGSTIVLRWGARAHAEGAWLGPYVILAVIAVVVFAAFVAVVLSVLAFARREPHARRTLLLSLPSLLVVISFASWAYSGMSEVNRGEALREYAAQVAADLALLDALAAESPMSERTARVLGSPTVQPLLTADQVRTMWHERKDLDTGTYYTSLIWPPTTPPDVLREYFERMMSIEERRDGGRNYRSLVYEDAFLRHPNLPDDIIEEVRGVEDERLLEMLRLNPKVSD